MITKLAAIAYAKQDPLFLEEIRRSKEKFDFERSAAILAEWTGRGHEEMRAQGLQAIAAYAESIGDGDPRAMIWWLYRWNKRLGIWCLVQILKEAIIVPNETKFDRSIELVISWASGRILKLRKLRKKKLQKAAEYTEQCSLKHIRKNNYATAWIMEALAHIILLSQAPRGYYPEELAYRTIRLVRKVVSMTEEDTSDFIINAIITFPPSK